MSHTSEDLSAYLDGELTEVEARALEKELSKNAALMAELTELREAQDFMRVHGPAQAPLDFYTNVLSAVDEESMDRSWWSWLARPFGIPVQGVAIAAIAMLVLVLTIPFNATQLFTTGTDTKSGMRAKSMDISSIKSYESAPAEEQSDEDMAPTAPEGTDLAVAAATPEQRADALPEQKAKPSKESGTVAKKKGMLLQQLGTEADGSAEATIDGAEQNGTATVPNKETTIAAQSKGYQYVIETTDTNAAYSLYALVQRHQGSLTNSSGRNAKPDTLRRGDTSVFNVYLDEDAINSFDRQLGSLGTVQRNIPKSMDLTSGGNRKVQVVIRVTNDTNAFSDGVQFDANIPNQKEGAKRGKKAPQ